MGSVIVGSYDYWLVALSFLIALLTSYTALDLAARVTANHGVHRLMWLLGGAFAMGSGIWCMHYTGMLAFRLPIPVYYHVPTVVRITVGRDRRLRRCAVRGKPYPHDHHPSRGGKRLHGGGHRNHALHRDGSHAARCDALL